MPSAWPRSRGWTIWDIQSRRETSGHVVRVFIDRPGPAATPEDSVSIEDCEQVNREIGHDSRRRGSAPVRVHAWRFRRRDSIGRCAALDDYRRFAGRLAKVVVSEAVDNQKAFEGRLRGVGRRRWCCSRRRTGGMHRLPLRLITRGRLEVEF